MGCSSFKDRVHAIKSRRWQDGKAGGGKLSLAFSLLVFTPRRHDFLPPP